MTVPWRAATVRWFERSRAKALSLSGTGFAIGTTVTIDSQLQATVVPFIQIAAGDVYEPAISKQGGNLGHRPSVKGGYFPVPPVDSFQDMRSEMCLLLEQMGTKHRTADDTADVLRDLYRAWGRPDKAAEIPAAKK